MFNAELGPLGATTWYAGGMQPCDLGPLAGVFLSHAAPEVSLHGSDPAPLERALAELLARAQATWPQLALPAEVFLRHLAAQVRGEPLEALSALHTDDLFLACACAQGISGALAAFDARFLSQVPSLLAKERLPPAALDEVCQQLRVRYLVAHPEAPPRISAYSGRGRLIGWVRVAALHLALNLFRKREDQVARQEGIDPALLLASQEDAELDYLRRRYQPEFKAAFQEAIAALPKKDRDLLRLHVVDGLSIDRIAPLFATSRATAARWLAAARQTVLDQTHHYLQQRLQIPAAEVASLAQILRSQLHLSLVRCLGQA